MNIHVSIFDVYVVVMLAEAVVYRVRPELGARLAFLRLGSPHVVELGVREVVRDATDYRAPASVTIGPPAALFLPGDRIDDAARVVRMFAGGRSAVLAAKWPLQPWFRCWGLVRFDVAKHGEDALEITTKFSPMPITHLVLPFLAFAWFTWALFPLMVTALLAYNLFKSWSTLRRVARQTLADLSDHLVDAALMHGLTRAPPRLAKKKKRKKKRSDEPAAE
jgi:hypothetical protein